MTFSFNDVMMDFYFIFLYKKASYCCGLFFKPFVDIFPVHFFLVMRLIGQCLCSVNRLALIAEASYIRDNFLFMQQVIFFINNIDSR